MRRIVYGLAAVSMLGLAGLGCRTVDEKRAEYHSWRAQRAEDKGNYNTAEKQRRKADEARRNLPTDKLP